MIHDIKLIEEMSKLTNSMQGLREAIKRQETQLTNYPKNGDFQDMQLFPNRLFSEEYKITEEALASSLGPLLHGTESKLSQGSHWSSSIETIHCSIQELKGTLKSHDKQVIRLMTENEELKKKLKKKDKELKKQKILLKAERENFDQYKRDASKKIQTHESTDFQDVLEHEHKTSKDIQKLNSELEHYRKLYTEHYHTVNRLAKQRNSLKDDNVRLKGKLLQQERQSNKFILEMAQRFDNSRKEMNLIMSKKIESYSIHNVHVGLYKIAERNARLAYDNSMLKKDLNDLKQQLIDIMTEENKRACFSLSGHFSSNTFPNASEKFKDISKPQSLAGKKISLDVDLSEFKGKGSQLGWNGPKDNISRWQNVLSKKSSANIIHWGCVTRSSGGLEEQLVRTYSAPDLNNVRN